MMQQNNNIGAEIRASGLAEVMVYHNKTKRWDSHSPDKQPSTVQVVYDREAQTFMMVISRLEDQRHVIVIQQQIYHNLKYQADSRFHQWRNETRTVYGLNFPNEQHAMDVQRAVREAQSFLNELINAEQINAGNAVYQEPQQNHYYTAQPTTAQPRQQQQEVVYARDADGDSLGSNGHRKYSNYAVHPQVTGQAIQQQATLQQQHILQQQRRASQGSSGSSSTVSGNIYATAHLNGYNAGNAVSATSNGAQMPITQIQQPIRLNNGPPNDHPILQHQLSNGANHQVPIRTAVPPAPAPPMMNVHQPAKVSNNAPPPPPPPPPMMMNGSVPAKPNTAPPAPPPPPANFFKTNPTGKPLTMSEEIERKKLRETKQNGVSESNGTSNGVKPKPSGQIDLMSELNNKLRKRNNQDEIASVTSAASTSSTNSNESVEKREPPAPPKSWTKPASTAPSTLTLNGTLTNGHTNGHTNGGINSPKCHKKQFSVSGASSTNDDPSTIMCTKADMDQLRHDVFSAMEKFKAEILEAIANSR